MTRRNLLLGASAALAAAASRSTAQETRLPKGAHVVVIGAGFAGIGAAESLLSAGYRVTQIEASDRTGGRALTRDLGGFPADIGANWLKIRSNPLMDFARDRGMIGAISDLTDAAVAQNGVSTPVDLEAASALMAAPLTAPYLWYNARRKIGLRPKVASAQALIGDALQNAGANGCGARRMLEVNFACDLGQLSGTVLLEPEPNGADEVAEPTVQGGMAALAQALAANTSPAFNERAEVIARTPDGVRIKTSKREISADAVIVTVSTGVLKSGGITFDPGLPPRHQAALAAMDMGNLFKIWMRFPSASWTQNHPVQALCGGSPFAAVVDFSASHGVPVLMGFAAGSGADAAEAMTEQETNQAFMDVLRSQLGLDLPEPVASTMSSWRRDPLFGGAYMYPNPQFRIGMNLALREPIAGRILLAGEALSSDFGYVDTAWEDGRRAAALITGAG